MEYDAAPSKILAHHWPDVPNHGDVTAVDWATMPPVDILTGGYPCQPFSQAGRRKGTNDDRHLWPYVREAIRVLRPRLVVLENVAGHRSLGFDRVLGDMAEDGLHVRWASLRASDIGAPHHRERLFIVAWQGSADTGHQPGRRGATDDAGAEGAGTHGISVQRGDGDTPGEHHAPGKNVADAEDDGLARAGKAWHRGARPTDSSGGNMDWGPYAAAVERWERLTRPAPAPTEPNRNNKPRLNAAFAEWMMGLPDGWVTSPDIGLSRAQQLKAIGNGVCVQQAEAALRHLLGDMQ